MNMYMSIGLQFDKNLSKLDKGSIEPLCLLSF